MHPRMKLKQWRVVVIRYYDKACSLPRMEKVIIVQKSSHWL